MGKRGPGSKALRKAAKASPIRGEYCFVWDNPGMKRYDRVVLFLERLPITAGVHAGRMLRLRGWQKRIVRKLYATDRKGRRIVRQALITLPRKNGKTALAAGLALCHLLGPESEKRGQVFSAAADRDQAAILFSEMEAIINEVPEFAARVNVQRFKKAIEDEVTGSVYQALSSDARKAHGLSPSFFVFDELAQSRTRDLYDNLITGMGARAMPLGLTISTMSSDPNHVMSELVDYGQKVNDGIVKDKTFHATIYQAPTDADPWDEKVWKACNPALGDFLSIEDMRTAAAQAKRIPAREASFRNLRLNQAVDAEARLFSSVDWEANAACVDPATLEGCDCWGGLDLSSTQDLTSLVLYFPHNGAVLSWFWLPGDGLKDKEEQDRAPYTLWKRQGFLETFPGRAVDKLAVVLRLADIAGTYNVQGIAFDRWGVKPLQKLMADEGVDLPLVDWGQGYKDMGPAVDALETAIITASLKHGDHPILAWNCANAIATLDPTGARKLDKAKSSGRIDGMVALTMAVGLHAREPKPMEYNFDRPMVITA